MAFRRRRPRRSLRSRAISKRPSDTWLRLSMSSQTVASGTPRMFDILPFSSPMGGNKDLNLQDREVMITQIIGRISWAPNLNERTIGNAFFESMAAYVGLKIIAQENTDPSRDMFTFPDSEWLWRNLEKQVYQSGAAGVAFDNFLKPGSQGGWTFNKRMAWTLKQREKLVCVANYTADGAVSNSTWWIQFLMRVCW